MNDIPSLLRSARLLAGLTQKQVGESCGYKGLCAQTQVAKWEAGTGPVPRKHIRKVADLLHIPINDLIP